MIFENIRRHLNECDRDGWSNLLTSLPFMFLQYEGSNPDLNSCTRLLTLYSCSSLDYFPRIVRT